MQLKLKEMKSKQSVMEAKAKNAEAQGKIAKQLKGIGTSSLANFQRYEEKINEMADQSEALNESLFAEKQLEREFEQLESSVQVSHELENLKDEVETEELMKREEMEKKKLEKLNLKLDVKPVSVQPAKAIAAPKEEKLRQFFGE